ncbi:MAG TPA: hypothetical protein VHE80_01130, partial [Acidimicrobiales bacterium]|nr:hypothetical protein [Acidimicrobiales bacterium]
MFSLATKLLFSLTGAALAYALGYGVAVGERSGTVLFLFLAAAALVAGLATLVVQDVAPVVPDDAPPPQPRAATAGAAPQGSAWPLAAALATALLVSGAALGTPVVIGGVVAVLAATAGWFARVWSAHPSWTPRVRERTSTRLLVPLGLPVAMVALALIIAISMSRILLAVPKNVAVGVALAVAIAILGACYWVASRPRLGSSALMALAALAGISTVGAGIAGAVAGEREFHAHEKEERVVPITAENIQFDRETIRIPAQKDVIIEFENEDEVFHNVAVYGWESRQAMEQALAAGQSTRPIFNGSGFAGPAERGYRFRVPPPGTYTFLCD